MNHFLACLLLLIVSHIALAQANLSAPSTVLPSAHTSSEAADQNVSSSDTDAPHVDFDVFSFRRDNSSTTEHHVSLPYNGDGFTAVNVSVLDILRYVFAGSTGKPFGVYGRPAWVDTDRYDIQTKINPEQISAWQRLDDQGRRQALRGFLVHSLTLKYHKDDAIRPFYALTVGKNGLRMQEDTKSKPFPTSRSICHYMPGNTAVGESCPMEGLADLLSRHTDAPVLDRTGLLGRYSFTLTFETASMPGSSSSHEEGPVSLPAEIAAPLIRSAVKQLGLELVPSKGQIDGIVIESIQRPPTD